MEKRGLKYHRGRVGEALREEIETLVEGELADPRIGLVSVTSVHVADDGRSAEVWINVEGDDAEADRSIEGLEAAREYIRHELVERLRIRRAPELYFRLDRAEQAKARVEELLAREKENASRARNPVEIRPNSMLEDVLRQIGQHERFVLTSHARPDGDAVGSALACCQVLREMGKQADVVLHDGVPRIYRSLPFADQVVQSSRVTGSYEAAIILECDSIHRTRLEGLEDRFLISIDHHVSGRPFAHVNWIDPHAVATAEMVFRLVREAGVKFSPEIATCLYTALMTDTGSFMFQGTNENTFALARELVLAGADPAHCARGIYFAHSVAKIRLLGEALRSLNVEGHIGYFWVTHRQMERCGAIEEDCEGLVNYVLSIGGVEVAAFFRELPDGRYRVSLRSKGKLNVARIAESFGGGGHECASGCSVDGPLAEAVRAVILQLGRGPSVQ